MREIYYLTKRNMLLYVRDHVSVFFSVLSMLIVLALMVVFLGSMNSENVVDALAAFGGVRDTAADEKNAAWLIQMWTLAGILEVNAVTITLRRTYHYQMRVQEYLKKDLYFDCGQSVLVCQNRTLELTKSEQRILSKLVEKRPEVVTRQELMMELWSTDEFISDGTLTTMISRLRSKLKGFCGEELIMTKKGQGYLLL